jgi:hypothetical protein
MSDTSGSPTAINDPAVPEIVFSMAPVASIDMAAGSYDPLTPADTSPAYDDLMPLIVRRMPGNRLAMIDGCKRLARMRAAGRSRCACGCIDIDEIGAGLLRIKLNRGRPWHFLEKLAFVRWLAGFFQAADDQLLSRVTGLPVREVRDFRALLDAPAPIIDAVAQGRIDIQHASALRAWSTPDQAAFLDLSAALSLSFQTQREFLEWLPEIAAARSATAASVLADAEVRAAIDNCALNPPQKIAAIREYLFRARFPAYQKAVDTWEQTGRRVNPDPACVQFQASPHFEKNRLEVRIVMHAPAQGAGIIAALGEINEADWARLINPVQSLNE